MPSSLDGQFALVALNETTGAWIAARDHVGICPLFMGRHRDGTIWFASELKSLVDDCDQVEIVPPGTAWHFDGHRLQQVIWYQPSWIQEQTVPDGLPQLDELRERLIAAVSKRLMSDVPFGFLLSGGLDSSLIASIAVRLNAERTGHREGGKDIHTFSIGLPGAPDLVAARSVARFLGTTHHEFHFTLKEALEAVPKVAWHMETVEQIRTAVPTYLLANRVRELGFKMVLSGEGADEVFAGYLYFHRAPNPKALFEETVRKVTRLHQFDVARADRAPMAHGLEVRFPFLDRNLLDFAMAIDPKFKMIDTRVQPDGRHSQIEKYILRKAFDSKGSEKWLPDEVLWRQKEQFSDGIGYAWVDYLRQQSSSRLTSSDWEQRADRFPIAAPRTPEQYWMRELFDNHFVANRRGGKSAETLLPDGRSLACSTPEALTLDPSWQGLTGDISGRTMAGIHLAAISQPIVVPI
jgi:asparagine synthase (glutamine-hydrolysing)